MIELRWLNNDISRTLQYRTVDQKMTLKYTYPDGDVLPENAIVYSDWKNVPEVMEHKKVTPSYE